MKTNLSKIDRIILSILAVMRGARVEDIARFLRLLTAANIEALRKRMSRLVAAGYLATSKLPKGKLLYRLSRKGAQIMDAPPAFAASPSEAIVAEIISKAVFGWKDEFHFPTTEELQKLLQKIVEDGEKPKLMGTFVLRRPKESADASLHFWLCELRSAEEIIKRAQTILAKLLNYACFRDLAETKLLGFTIVVPTTEAKDRLAGKWLGIPTRIEVCEDLQSIFNSTL